MATRRKYADETISTTPLKLGSELAHMSDSEVLEAHNDVIRAQEEMTRSYEHVAVEVHLGKPQIEYFFMSDQWLPRGDVWCALSRSNR